MISVCARLAIIDIKSGIIQVVHHTAHEYLAKTHSAWFPQAKIHITQIYVTYLLFDAFATG